MAETGLFSLVLIWTTREQLSQGKLGGRRGSSACTIIAVLLAEIASRSCKLLLPHRGRLCDKWYSAVADAISEGNSIYDRYVDKPGILLDLLDVSEIFVKDQEKHLHITETKPVWLSPSTDPFTCTLCYNVTQFSQKKGQNFAVFICQKKSVLIVSDGTGKVLVIDTHFHADTNSGTYFIYGDADEVAWYFTKNYPGKAVGTLTEVSFVLLVD